MENVVMSFCHAFLVMFFVFIALMMLVIPWFALPAWAALIADVVFLGTWIVCYLRVE
jgi:hypothetical protein